MSETPVTAHKVPQPSALIASLEPASCVKISAIFASEKPAAASTSCSRFFTADTVVLNPATADTSVTPAKNMPAGKFKKLGRKLCR